MFEVGKSYVRRELHDKYGGQRQGGISTPAKYPVIFLFTGGGGEQWGYRDRWEADGTFRFSGEGQRGDMQFRAGNKAIRDHAANGEQLHLFETDRHGKAKY
jgi:5-methylcytosine-specific restriction protein A